jgi:hypothetical protein
MMYALCCLDALVPNWRSKRTYEHFRGNPHFSQGYFDHPKRGGNEIKLMVRNDGVKLVQVIGLKWTMRPRNSFGGVLAFLRPRWGFKFISMLEKVSSRSGDNPQI